jgi:hypothetical protein
MALKYRTISREGNFWGDIVSTMKKFGQKFRYVYIPNEFEAAGSRYKEEDKTTFVALSRYFDRKPITYLHVTSDSQDRNIIIADRIGDITGVFFEQSNAKRCAEMQEFFDERLRADRKSTRLNSSHLRSRE